MSFHGDTSSLLAPARGQFVLHSILLMSAEKFKLDSSIFPRPSIGQYARTVRVPVSESPAKANFLSDQVLS